MTSTTAAVALKNEKRGSKIAQVWPWLAAIATGCTMAFFLPRFNQTWLCWVALAPLICAVWFSPAPKRRKWLRDLLLGYVSGVIFFGIAFGWLGSLASLMNDNWLLTLPMLVALYMGSYVAVWAWFIGLLPRNEFLFSRRNLWIALLGAAAWTALEWVRGWLFSGWGWNGLGVALHGELAMIQIVEWTGVMGLSFLIAFVNLIAVITVRRFIAEIGKGRLRPHWDFSLTMLMVVCVFGYGARIIVKKPVAGTAIRVAAVQANIPQNEKFDKVFEDKVYAKFTDLTGVANALQSQLIIWPEASTPGDFFLENNVSFIRNTVAKGEFNLLFGSLELDPQIGDYNVAILASKNTESVQLYRKIHLVPFGEYIPLRNEFPLFRKLGEGMVPGDFRAGTQFTVFETKNPSVKIAPLICFEDTIGDLTRQFVLGGAQLLVNVTNDGWFGHSPAAEQQLANAVFRTVETRRPMVRSANTGVTCFIDEDGRVTAQLPLFSDGVLTRTIEVPDGSVLTFYTRHGEWLPMACAALSVGWLLTRLRFVRRQ